mmetsp:Transcript_13275/g.43748  ORF Transcript_13275/g.43748 Transcript_13275/m.43748 type:complete len:85 (-) Transcript_13275:113-367(-)
MSVFVAYKLGKGGECNSCGNPEKTGKPSYFGAQGGGSGRGASSSLRSGSIKRSVPAPAAVPLNPYAGRWADAPPPPQTGEDGTE